MLRAVIPDAQLVDDHAAGLEAAAGFADAVEGLAEAVVATVREPLLAWLEAHA